MILYRYWWKEEIVKEGEVKEVRANSGWTTIPPKDYYQPEEKEIYKSECKVVNPVTFEEELYDNKKGKRSRTRRTGSPN